MRREELGALSHAELVGLVLRQQALLEQAQATIAEQQALIARLEARVRELEERLGSDGPRGMPGLKPRQAAPGPKRPRKRRAHGFARPRMEPTQRVVHAVAQCPRCASPLSGGALKRTREVLEIVRVPVRVIEHVYLERRCPSCQARVVPPAGLPGQVVGRQRLGLSLIAVLREEGRLPLATIQWYLRTVHRLRLSLGALVGALQQVARRGAAAAEQIRQQVRASPVIHADETGWRENGRNGYVWTFSTPSARYFIRRGRNKEVVDEVLGSACQGVLCSDFYAAYNHYPGLKQRCWAHLLRDIHDLGERHPTDERLRAWATQIHGVYERAKRFASPSPAQRQRAQRRFQDELLALCTPCLHDTAAPQRTLCARIEKFLPELFVFVAQPEVPADNNAAERSLRPLVTSRKISGGTRSEAGSATKLVLASLFGTWRLQGRDPFLACRQVLASPQL